MVNNSFTLRSYQSEEDFWRMRDFLRRVFLLNNHLQRSWHVARLDYARWHGLMNCAKVRLEDVVFIWEASGEITAFLMHEGIPGEMHFAVNPLLQTPGLERSMLLTAEEHHAVLLKNGNRGLKVWAPATDALRIGLLHEYGYAKDGETEIQRCRQLDAKIPDASLPSGYEIRSLGEGLELLERCYASGLGFHDGDIAIAIENRNDPTWYRNIQKAPLYRRDLDLVAIAPDGSIAAFCTIWFDDFTRSACFEPVATVPTHRRLGLGRALMTKGLQRLKNMGATTAFVGGQEKAANVLYKSVMGPGSELYECWSKEW